MVVAACPNRQQLRRLALGHMLPAEVEGLAAHCESCAHCILTLQQLGEWDTLVEAMAAQATVGRDVPSPAVDTLIERLKGLTPFAGPASGEALEPAATADFSGLLQPAQEPSELGRLGNYRILKVLGQGGMGVVFQAEDQRLGRLCALKAMRPEVARKPGMKERFLREARAAAQVEHEHIIPIYQVDEDHGVPFIAMPLLKGATLEEWLCTRPPDTPLPVPAILRLGREIATGLDAAHVHGLIHRDIKPANLWLETSAACGVRSAECSDNSALCTPHAALGKIKILDFGLARLAAAAGEQHLTQAGAILGTPAYMAPEQARGEPVDGRADLFSLGVVLYRLSTGKLPFERGDLMGTLMAVALSVPAPPCLLNPALPPALSSLVLRLLAKEPARRFGSAQEVVRAIAALEQGRTHNPESRRRGLMLGSVIAAAVLLLTGMAFLISPFLRTNQPLDGTAAGLHPGNEQRPVVIDGPPLLRTTLDHQGKVQALAFTPDGKWLVSGARNSVAGYDLKIFDAKSGRLVYQEASGGIQALALTPDGKTLITGGYQTDADRNILRIFNLSSWKSAGTIAIETPGIDGLAVAPNGRTLAYGETPMNQTLVQLHDLAAGREIASVPVGHYGSHGLKYSPDGRFLAVCLHGVYLVILATESLGEVTRRDVGFSTWVDISRDSRRILAGGSVDGMPAIHLIGLPDGDLVHVEQNLPAAAAAGAFSPTGDLLAVALADGSVRLVDARKHLTLADWAAHAPFPVGGHNYRGAVIFSPDGHTLATASGEGLIKLWDLTRPASGAVPTAEAPFSSFRSAP